MAEYEQVVHPFPPFYRADSEVLILGSLPSVKSREQGFYYGHPRNRFWRMLLRIFGEKRTLKSIEKKKRFLAKHRLALYDVIYSCEIRGSSDSSIR
ncbi:MAG: uracil-DNA glycosylase family protein, partial [Lachnospiraceae bacterium]|nr:uracil-DNA glycosylase family protein [Lachnospiraceae bacterium]